MTLTLPCCQWTYPKGLLPMGECFDRKNLGEQALANGQHNVEEQSG